MSKTVWRKDSASLHHRSMLLLGLSDLLVISAMFVLSAQLLGTYGDGWKLFTVALLPTYLTLAIRGEALHGYAIANPFTAIATGCRALLQSVGLLILLAFYAKSADVLPRLMITVASALSLGLLVVSRYLIVRHLPAILGGNPFSTVLIQDGDAVVPGGNFSIAIRSESFFDPDTRDPKMYDRLANTLASADRVVISCPRERRTSWVHAMQGSNIQAEIFVDELVALGPLGLGGSRLTPSVIIATGPLNLVDRAIKRSFDLTFASIALIILLPILLITALAIKLDSPGPVLFRQLRIGRGNRLFGIYKFRSMRTESSDADASRLTSRTDDRVTRVGRVIRKTSIDELPQLLQVLTGYMSIVGPRPHATGARAADKLYWEVDHRYWHRHAAKPGLTGLAQVRGFRGNTELEVDLSNRLSSDLEYLERWSIWRDLKIIVLTLRVVFHRNAF